MMQVSYLWWWMLIQFEFRRQKFQPAKHVTRHLLDISAPNLKSDQNKQQTIKSVINIYQLREIEA